MIFTSFKMVLISETNKLACVVRILVRIFANNFSLKSKHLILNITSFVSKNCSTMVSKNEKLDFMRAYIPTYWWNSRKANYRNVCHTSNNFYEFELLCLTLYYNIFKLFSLNIFLISFKIEQIMVLASCS